MSNLVDNIDSDYINTISFLRPKSAPQHIVVYVEDDYDVNFWKQILSEYFGNKYVFEVIVPCQNEKLVYGKPYILKEEKLSQYGPNLWACVDSDYDLILSNSKYHTALKLPFIYSTYTYSVENHKCLANDLKKDYGLITLSSTDIDFNHILTFFSESISELFLIHLVSHYNHDDKLNIHDFYNYIVNFKCDSDYEEKWGKRIQGKLAQYSQYKNDNINIYTKIKDFFDYNNIQPSQYYLFMRGHDIQKIVVKILKYYCQKEIHNKICNIKSKGTKDTLNKYISQIHLNENGVEQRVIQVITDSSEFCHSPLICHITKKISQDLVNVPVV